VKTLITKGFQTLKSCLKKKSAFTLAEVLITIGIIGIVAAITIPSLITNYHVKEMDAQTRKAFAKLSEGYKLLVADYDGNPPACYGSNVKTQTSECDVLWDALPKYIKMAKSCKGNAYADGCLPSYNGVDTISRYTGNKTVIWGCSNWLLSNLKNKVNAYVLMDGTIMFYLPGSPRVAFDVNGFKGPNKWGHDIHTFWFREDPLGRSFHLSPNACEIQEDWGKVEPRSINDILNIYDDDDYEFER
jgi:prepilin-type N-terminal cleavage/methylation domain-containing protein